MKLYTKTGDTGETSLFGGTRVKKSHTRIEAYGTIDELNAYVGYLKDQDTHQSSPTRKQFLLTIQNFLFVIGAHLATPIQKKNMSLPPLPGSEDCTHLEEAIDQIEKQVGPMRHFILPGGHPSISIAHIARCVCRRAERRIISLSEEEEEKPVDPKIVIYINRLSDYFFMLTRLLAQELHVTEQPWLPQKSK